MKKFRINIIKYSNIWLAISAVVVALSLISTFTFAFPPRVSSQFPFVRLECPTICGIDFKGGSLIEVRVPGSSLDEVRSVVSTTGHEATVQTGDDDSYFIRMAPISEGEHQAILTALKASHADVTETKFDSVGPTIGKELKKAAAIALVVLLVLIAAYVAWAFRKVSDPVPSWKYGVATSIAAFHDVIIPIGVFALLGHFFHYEIDTAFVAAMLTILGYSINDTIVVLDRTRENLHRHRHADMTFGEIVNESIMETMSRSLNTTFATLLPLVAIVILGGETTRSFVLALVVGILAGAYSSIFVASPVLVLWEKWSRK